MSNLKREGGFKSAAARAREEIQQTQPVVEELPAVSPDMYAMLQQQIQEMRKVVAASGKAKKEDLLAWGMVDVAPGYKSKKFSIETGHSFQYNGVHEMQSDTCVWCGRNLKQLVVADELKTPCAMKPAGKY